MGAVRSYIDILIIIITFPYSTCISSFFGSSIPTCLFIFKMFFLSGFTNSKSSRLVFQVALSLQSAFEKILIPAFEKASSKMLHYGWELLLKA